MNNSMRKDFFLTSLTIGIAASITAMPNAQAESGLPQKRSAANVMFEEVVVTATKKASAEQLQDVPIAVTAYNEKQLSLLNARDLQDLSYSMPNVSMDEVGTTKGVANFSFRGLGINSSIPSIDPTVGVFIDGVYLGSNYGVVFDQFDLSSIEVLRGPQGLLFGRNVTGGAVVVNTKSPSDELEGSVRASVESGLNTYLTATVTGPLIEDKLLGKLAVYRNSDDGYFKNDFNGNDSFGESDTTLFRGGLTYLSDSGAEFTVKYEHGSSDGDGPAAQNHALFDRDSFDFSVDEEGFYDTEWDFISAKYSMDLGSGVLTNIVGWRELSHLAVIDLDSTANYAFHAGFSLESEQFSEELRYNITLDNRVDLTAGVYYFSQDMLYIEDRTFAGGTVNITGGGTQDQYTVGVFTSADWRLSDSVTINTGVRYTVEEKEAKIATLSASLPCNLDAVLCTANNFDDEKRWSNVTPKIGAQWFVNDEAQVYTSYSKGFRSGGYNMRNASATTPPGPFDEEEQDAFEVGIKWDMLDGKLRLNAAAFHNTISDMQREVLVSDPTVGLVQSILNTADATIQGVELELTAMLTEHLIIGANLGVMDGDYKKVDFDINGDGSVDSEDESLDLPRLAPVTGGVNVTWEDEIFSEYTLLARLSYSYRDESAYTDNNRGYFNAMNRVDANISFITPDQSLKISLFGRNITDEVSHGGHSQLPASATFGYSGGTNPSFSPLNKGRVYGLDVSYNF